MSKPLLMLCALVLATGTARGATADNNPPAGEPPIAAIVKGGGCAPKDNMARVLKSAHPLDYAPNWSGTTYIGTGWTFMPKRYVVDPSLKGGVFLEGNLITTRGALMPDDLFVVYAEWDCAH